MVTEDYVSFEVAKLLKEKGFDEATYSYYMTTKTLNVSFHTRMHVEEEPIFNSTESKSSFGGIYSAPTHQMAMKWLREDKDCPIEILWHFDGDSQVEEWYFRHHKELGQLSTIRYYSTYEEAVEAAIKYCLETLI